MGRRVLQKFTEKQIQINTDTRTNQHKYKYKSTQIQLQQNWGRAETKLAEGAPPITDGGTMKGGGGRTPIHVLPLHNTNTNTDTNTNDQTKS